MKDEEQNDPEIPSPAIEPNQDDSLLRVLEQHAEQLNQQSEALDDHEQSLNTIIDQLKEPARGQSAPVGWSWRHITGQQRQQLWEELAEFVEWINQSWLCHESDRQLPSCWYRHPNIVEELTACWAAWHGAAYDHEVPDEAMAAWADRYFHPMIARLERDWWAKDCRSRPSGHAIKSFVPYKTDAGFAGFVHEDVGVGQT